MQRRRQASIGGGIQLALGGADRLVALLEERQDALAQAEAASALLALRGGGGELARKVLSEVVASDARLVVRPDGRVGLAGWQPARETPFETARFTVVDLETTGVGVIARILEIGAVRVSGFTPGATFQRLVDPGVPVPVDITKLTGITELEVRRTGEPIRPALAAFLEFARGSVLVAHNARFDIGFLNRALVKLDGRRLALPVLDTVLLARRLLRGRLPRCDLRSLSERFSTSVQPCHRALPDAQATAEVLAALLGLAQERGVETVEGAIAFAGAPEHRARGKRALAAGIPEGPGVYVMRDARGQALYVGKASDLRSRTRSYFGPQRHPPSLAGALAVLDRFEVAPLGSELEASLAEISLLQAWRPPANVRSARPDRYAYLRLGVADPVPALGVRGVVRDDGAVYAGPFRSRKSADEAAHGLRDAFGLRTCRPRLPVDDGSCLRGLVGRCHAPCHGAAEADRYADAVGRLRAYFDGHGEGARGAVRLRVRELSAARRFEEARRQARRASALDSVDAGLAAIRRARARSGLLLAADVDERQLRVFAVRNGLVVDARTIPRRGDPWAALSASLGALGEDPDAPPTLRAVGPDAPEAAALAPLDIPGPWLPADRLDAALIAADAFAGNATGVVAVATLPGASGSAIAERVAGARERVPVRVSLPQRRWPRWQELQRIAGPGDAGEGVALAG